MIWVRRDMITFYYTNCSGSTITQKDFILNSYCVSQTVWYSTHDWNTWYCFVVECKFITAKVVNFVILFFIWYSQPVTAMQLIFVFADWVSEMWALNLHFYFLTLYLAGNHANFIWHRLYKDLKVFFGTFHRSGISHYFTIEQRGPRYGIDKSSRWSFSIVLHVYNIYLKLTFLPMQWML